MSNTDHTDFRTQPEPVAPTDEDLYDLADVFNGEPVAAMRRALELWGTPAIHPVPTTDQEIQEWADACEEAPLEELDPGVHGWRRCFTAQEFSETIRAAIARWGTPANNTGGTH